MAIFRRDFGRARLKRQELPLCRIFWSPGGGGVQMTFILILEYKLLWLKQTVSREQFQILPLYIDYTKVH